MAKPTEADCIRILVATDNHVGFEERDAIRKDDSWRTLDEIINLARTEDVDMVLLSGDLFHDNKPSQKSLYQVLRTLRQNCLGLRPCPLEFLSDAAEVFEGAFTHVNYEDPDINVSIPIFSIHGNHDDPSGDGNFCSLDLLQASGLVNYFGRVAEADNIEAKPILLRKGLTKLALYGLSNVRDERMFRTFRDHRVKWFRPNTQMGDWFNLLALHQNHHAHTATSYLPENVLPDWLNLVVWGHEHECLIDPSKNPETGFYVMQPGSSVATSLVQGEAVQKHVAIVSVTGKDFKVKKIPLKTVRPLVIKELVLSQDSRFKGLDKKKDNRQELTRRLVSVVDEMIEEANAGWSALQTDEEALEEQPLPLIRLKVEYTAPEGGQYDCENPQRLSNRFVGKVANTNDVVYFHRKKSLQRKAIVADPSDALESLVNEDDTIKVECLVQDFLSAQSLKVLPQGPFGDAVSQFVAKDDKHAMELFVTEHLTGQVHQMLGMESDDEDLSNAMQIYRSRIEQQNASGVAKVAGGRWRILQPKPATWDSDFDGHWEEAPGAWTYEDLTSAADSSGPRSQERRSFRAWISTLSGDHSVPRSQATTENATASVGRRAATGQSRTTTLKNAPKSTAGKPSTRRNRRTAAPQTLSEGEEEEEEDDYDMILPPDDEEPPPPPPPKTATRKSNTPGNAVELSDDEISDDDAFDPAPVASRTRRR